MNFTKTIINSIKCWVNKQIKDVNEKIADLNTNVNDNFMTKDAMNTKMDAENPVGTGSFSMNRSPDSVVGAFSHAEGSNTIASGYCSHAEGSQTRSTGLDSHAEGSQTRATGNYSHAEGYSTRASGMSSHAEGDWTTASGYLSHAEGEHTIAASSSQHVQGKYNIEDTEDKYAHIVGNGDNNVRSNAHTLDWDGNAWFAGGIRVGGAGQDDEAAVEVALKTDILSPDLSQTDETASDYVKGVIRQESLPEGYPYKTETENVILPETEFTTAEIDGMCAANLEATVELIIGNTYNVTFDGDEYTCVASNPGSGLTFVGNAKFVGGTDTGEPFGLGVNSSMSMVAVVTESANTYTISIKEVVDSYSKIDENYLPDYVAGPPIEFVVSEDGTSVSCDLSSEELLSLSVHDLQKRCVLVDGSMKLIPQSIATGTLTSAHGYHTTITFVSTYCSSVNAIVRDPVYVVIKESGGLEYITATEFKEADIVRTASPGQTIVVKAVDDDGKPTEWEAVDMPEHVQPDLSQNDPEAADYVKGVIRQESLPEGYMSWNSMIHKPFVKFESKIIEWDGDKEGHDKVILSGDGSGFQASCYWVSDYIPFHGLELGDNVSATINVTGVGFSGEDKNGAFTEWSVTYNSENSRNIANFGYIALKDDVEEENYNGETISFPKKGLYLYENITGVLPPFSIEFAEAIRTIDESYIPDTIPHISSASSGQTILIKAVDKKGKPTEWEAVDMNVLTSPSGKNFKITIDDDGVLTATEIV